MREGEAKKNEAGMKERVGGGRGLRDQETEKQLECHPIISSFHSTLFQGEQKNGRERGKQPRAFHKTAN